MTDWKSNSHGEFISACNTVYEIITPEWDARLIIPTVNEN